MSDEKRVSVEGGLAVERGLVADLATPIAIVAVPVVQAAVTKYGNRPKK